MKMIHKNFKNKYENTFFANLIVAKVKKNKKKKKNRKCLIITPLPESIPIPQISTFVPLNRPFKVQSMLWCGNFSSSMTFGYLYDPWVP